MYRPPHLRPSIWDLAARTQTTPPVRQPSCPICRWADGAGGFGLVAIRTLAQT